MLVTIAGLTGAVLFESVGGAGARSDIAVVDAEESGQTRNGTAQGDARQAVADQSGNAPVEPAEAIPQHSESETRDAATSARVVERAGFPIVAGEEVQAAPSEPTVTVNGRPIGSTWAPAANDFAQDDAPETASEQTEVAAVAPEVAPTPIPRPEGLQLPRVAEGTQPDYEAITAAAHAEPEPVRPQQRSGPELIGPVGAVGSFLNEIAPQRQRTPDPASQGLVQVQTQNGQTLWVYPEQARELGYTPSRSVPASRNNW